MTRLPYVAVASVVLVLDQASKWWAWDRLREGREEVDVVDGLLRLIYAENPGIAFSFFNSGAEATRWVLVAASATAACIVAYYLFSTDPGARRLQLTLSLLLGGITGNLVDRALMGRVIDFIDLYWGSYHWPTFNVADSAISVGAALLAWELLRSDSEPARAVEGPTTGG